MVLQPCNEHDSDPQLQPQKRSEISPSLGVFVSIWIQWRPEVMQREKLKAIGRTNRTLSDADRNYLITSSVNVPVDSSLLSRWGTSISEPPRDQDRFAMKAMAHRWTLAVMSSNLPHLPYVKPSWIIFNFPATKAVFLMKDEGRLGLRLLRTRTRTNTNPNDTEANGAGRSVRACVARK